LADFGAVKLSAAHRRFLREVRSILDAELPADREPAAFVLSEEAPDPRVMAVLARHGWIMPRWPRAAGGAGLDQVQARLLEQELARRDATVPGGMRIAVGPVTRHGSEELKAEVLPRVAQGRAMVCLGYTEPDSGSDAAAAKTRAERRGDHWLVNGQKIFTTSAHFADYCWVLTRTNPDAPKHRGLTMFLVPMGLPGIEVRPLPTLGRGRSNVLYLTDVEVPDRYRCGPVDGGWPVAGMSLDEGHGATPEDDAHLAPFNGLGWVATTALERALEAATAWARTAVSTGGRRPIDDPDVRRRLASVALDIEVSWNTPGEMGRVIAAETLVRDVGALADLVGPESVITGGDLETALRFAQASLTFGGTVEIFRNTIAQRRLGLPRPAPPAREPAR
jgi:3-oxocholest-4-en-26-oyl-CoA dehydrogenase alpha subunit